MTVGLHLQFTGWMTRHVGLVFHERKLEAEVRTPCQGNPLAAVSAHIYHRDAGSTRTDRGANVLSDPQEGVRASPPGTWKGV